MTAKTTTAEMELYNSWRKACDAFNAAGYASPNPYTFEDAALWGAVVVAQNRLYDFEQRMGLGYLVTRV